MASTFSPNQSIKLTKSRIDQIAPPPNGPIFYRDTQLNGYALRVTAGGGKSFVVEERIEGRVRRVTLAKFGELTCEQARREAQNAPRPSRHGHEPHCRQNRERLGGLVVEQVFADFKKTRATLKPRTLYDYERLLQTALTDW